MRRSLLFATLCLSALLGGCSSSEGPLDPAVALDVSVNARKSLRLENASSRAIYYFVIERNMAALANWAPCTSPEQPCPRVQPRSQTQVPYSRIAGYEPGAREAIVYWWHLVERDGGWAVDHVRSVVVQL
ncbi:MAG TPA: hypothetical protein VHG08_06360 [Longimicrobium sp.]|nr:hypothetical protein [Longimicrobium sp.]